WYPSGHPEEFGLTGTADQEKSMVHVFPRLPTSIVCDGEPGHACLGIGPEGGNSFTYCACNDSQAVDCTCDTLSTPRYFTCTGGPFKGMACTRDRHCNPGGQCTAKPHCQDPGAVWTGPSVDKNAECEVDADPKCGPHKTQCGYRLFNLEDAIANPTPLPDVTGDITLDTTISPTGTRKRRGVCKTDAAKCGNGSGGGDPGSCSPQQGDCRGYVLTAGGS